MRNGEAMTRDGPEGTSISEGGIGVSYTSGDDFSRRAARDARLRDLVDQTASEGLLCTLHVFRGDERVGILLLDPGALGQDASHDRIVCL